MKHKPIIRNGMVIVPRPSKIKRRKNHRGPCLPSLNDGRCLYCKAAPK